MADRSVTSILPPSPVIDDGDMRLFRALPRPRHESVGPYVFVDHYRHASKRGIGDRPHPHAGIEVISYLLDGSSAHRDSLGNRDQLNAGDAQWIRAGRGMIHAEVPAGGRHGLQMWTALPPEQMLAEPEYRSFRASAIPQLELDGNTVTVVAGTVMGITGPVVTATGAVLAHVALGGMTSLVLSVDPAAELGVYVVAGELVVAGQLASLGETVILGPGDTIVLTAGGPAQAALFGGPSISHPLVFDGPFVMDKPERIVEAYRSFRSGGMGHLTDSDDPA